MKKTAKKMNLNRETLHWLTGGVTSTQTGTVSIPSCVDGCPSVWCTTTTYPATN